MYYYCSPVNVNNDANAIPPNVQFYPEAPTISTATGTGDKPTASTQRFMLSAEEEAKHPLRSTHRRVNSNVLNMTDKMNFQFGSAAQPPPAPA